MFSLFRRRNQNECPIPNEMRLWLENSFLWLATEFGQENIATKPMLFPTPDDFPILYDGSEESMRKTAEIVASQMEVDFGLIELGLFEQRTQEFNTGFGRRIWTEPDPDDPEKMASGLYLHKNGDGKYQILIEKQNLQTPESLVATLSHEFAHIKILGENRLHFNDEELTDLATVAFGLGIFNANSAFKEFRTADSYGHNAMGYLKQREWGYALALYAYFRREEISDWTKFLSINLQSDFRKSMDFIRANQERIFQEDYIP